MFHGAVIFGGRLKSGKHQFGGVRYNPSLLTVHAYRLRVGMFLRWMQKRARRYFRCATTTLNRPRRNTRRLRKPGKMGRGSASLLKYQASSESR